MESQEGTQSVPLRAGRIRVLHVDDDREFADLTATFLERERDDIEVVTETSVSDGLERLADERVDCVVSDYEMPRRDGLEFLEAVRADYPDLPFVLFTGKGSEAVASDAFAAGATDYLQKERGTDQYTVLANRIESAVEKTRAQRHQRRHRQAIESAREGIGILDEEGTFVYVNEAWGDMYGYEPRELIGERWESLYPSSERSRVSGEILPAVEADGYWHGQTTGRCADGTTFPLDQIVSTTDDGEYICTVRDLSEREDWEQELERYRTVVEAVGDPVYVLDTDGRFAYVNDSLVEMAGYEREEIIGEHASLILPESAVADARETISELLDDGESRTATREMETITADGRHIPVEIHLSLLPFDDGAFQGTAGVVRDITERKERELELERFETIIDALGDPVYAVDADGRYTFVNGAFVEEFGYEREEIIGEHGSKLIPEPGLREIRDATQRLLSDDDARSATVEYELVTASDARLTVENRLALLPTEDGAFQGTAGVARDITERKERERELARQNERLDEFASVVSHDLRNPLRTAEGRLELARRECDSPHLEDVADAHDRMETLIEDLLTFAREGTRVEEIEPVALADVVTACWPATSEATLVLETEQTIRADEPRLRQLLENLFRNAVEHGSTSPDSHARQDAVEHGSADSDSQAPGDTTDRDGVTMTVGALAGGFYVADDGPGIPAEDRDSVFEAGYTTSRDGTGLGLAIVRNIAEAHGWEIAATDSETGGARFEITGVTVAE